MQEKRKVFNTIIDLHRIVRIFKSLSHFNAVGNAVVLVMFTTSVPWTLFASELLKKKKRKRKEK